MLVKSSLMVSTDSKPRTTSHTLGVLMNFITELSPVSPSVKVAFPARLERVGMRQVHIYLPPSRPNSVLKISSHPPPLCRSLGCPRRCGSPFFVLWALGRRLRSRL